MQKMASTHQLFSRIPNTHSIVHLKAEMKYFIAILAFVALVHADYRVKTPAELKAILEDCTKEHPASGKDAENIKNLDFPDNEAGHQTVLCVVSKVGTFTEQGGYNVDNVVAQFKGSEVSEDQIRETMSNCAWKNQKKDGSAAVWAWRVQRCVQESANGPKLLAYARKLFSGH